jgi:hypothetical protein
MRRVFQIDILAFGGRLRFIATIEDPPSPSGFSPTSACRRPSPRHAQPGAMPQCALISEAEAWYPHAFGNGTHP